MTLPEIISVLFHGVAYGMVLYVISVGLSLTMGLMGFANLAHGVFAMAGGYLLFLFMQKLHVPFPLALTLVILAVALIGLIAEQLLYARLYNAGELAQVLLCIGLIFVAVAIARLAFGAQSQRVILPDYLQGQIHLFGRDFLSYRVFVIAFSLLLISALWLGLERTRWGAMVRASVDNSRMAQSIGINTLRVFTVTFTLGTALAGLGGALGLDLLAVQPTYPFEYLVYFLVVVSIGGLGSIRGPFFAALLIGLGDTACKYWIPELGSFFLYLAVIALLGLRPAGIFGARA
jgi:branched-chain amino acid transport system permease protein